MTDLTKRIIAGALVTFLVAVLIYGTLLPYRKSKDYVTAISRSGQATSLQDFLGPFVEALNDHSPIGQEETFRNFTQTVAGVVGSVTTSTPDTRLVLQALGATVDKYALPLVERKSATSQAQTYYVVGTTYLRLYDLTKIKAYQARGRELLERGLELSPDRPQLLYTLFQYEQIYGSREEARTYGERILKLWPGDKDTERKLKQIGS